MTTTQAQTGWTYVAELVQTDPAGSPTPGCGHYAGKVEASDPGTAYALGMALIGQPVPAAEFFPCCDWQDRETPITSINMIREDPDGNPDESWTHEGVNV